MSARQVGGGAAAATIVIGNGPVGQTTALLLARWGLPVIVLDARPGRDLVGSRAICQQRDVLDVWDACGAGQVAAEGLTWSRARTFYQDRELFAVDVPDAGRSSLPPFVNISQARTEQILDGAVRRQPLIDVRWGHEVVGVDSGAKGVRVRCRVGGGDGDGRERVVEGGYAVACGGARGSTLRTLLGVDFPGRSFDDAFLICDIRADVPAWDAERRFYFDPRWNPGRQVLIHPCPGGTFRIDWQVEPGFDLAAARADGSLERRIRQVVGGHPYELEWASVYRFHSRHASAFRAGRVLLAGDLAHVVAPFGARGLNSGVADAENAAWKIAFALRGWAAEEILDSYESERHGAALENLEVTGATMDFLVPHGPEALRRRHDLLEAAVHDPAARALVDSGRLAEPFWYVDSPLTTPAADRPWPGRPARGCPPAPVPGVILPDAPLPAGHHPAATRVRQLCRSGLLVLARPGADLAGSRAALARILPAGLSWRVLRLADVDPEGVLVGALACSDDEMWLVRPDAHTAACVRSPAALADAARRVLAR